MLCAIDGGGDDLFICLISAVNATKDEFAEVWNNSAKMETAMSYYLCCGAQDILDGENDTTRGYACFISCSVSETNSSKPQAMCVLALLLSLPRYC